MKIDLEKINETQVAVLRSIKSMLDSIFGGKNPKLSVSVNGHQTLAGTNANPRAGRILLQSEGAEVYFRRLDVYPLN